MVAEVLAEDFSKAEFRKSLEFKVRLINIFNLKSLGLHKQTEAFFLTLFVFIEFCNS